MLSLYGGPQHYENLFGTDTFFRNSENLRPIAETSGMTQSTNDEIRTNWRSDLLNNELRGGYIGHTGWNK
jgi:hypothetical protein